MAKKAMIDILWRSGAAKERVEAAKRTEVSKAKPGPKHNTKLTSRKVVQLSKSKGSQVASSRLAKMWESQWDSQRKSILAAQVF